MTRNEYSKVYYEIFGVTHLQREFWQKHRDTLKISSITDSVRDFILKQGTLFMKQYIEKNIMDTQFAIKTNCMEDYTNPYSLGNCIAATPCTYALPKVGYAVPAIQEKGNNPMRIENTTATAYVTAPKSDDATSRDYLLSRLAIYDGWHDPKASKISDFFNLGEDGRPKSYLQLIDAIKNDKFSLDPKAVARLKRIQDEAAEDGEDFDVEDYGYGPFYGIVFTDFPKADRKGYEAAMEEYGALKQTTRDTIMVKSPAEGLTALQTLEAWTPTGKAS